MTPESRGFVAGSCVGPSWVRRMATSWAIEGCGVWAMSPALSQAVTVIVGLGSGRAGRVQDVASAAACCGIPSYRPTELQNHVNGNVGRHQLAT